ncbi:MAG: HD domain-containing protein [Synergistaceae bacterium]|jgi:hypothetical protein|nr:HD domain-containing protein [Synergistaceae bacterium]
MFVDLEGIRRWFDGYVGGFDLGDPMIEMKRVHSIDVWRVGGRLVEAMSWPRPEAEVGSAACLLHDVGRFTQYRDFGTYYDRASVDHGERGYDVLSTEFPSALADAEAMEAVLQAVRHHNKKDLPSPDSLPPAVLPFCRLVRDADKLDIFALTRRRMDAGTLDAMLPGHAARAEVTPALLDEIEACGSGSYRNAHTLLDFLLIQLTWIEDLNFAPSRRMLYESGILERIRGSFVHCGERTLKVVDGLLASER